jgi:hypothetical protein
MELQSGLTLVVGVLLALAGSVTGSLILLRRARDLRLAVQEYGLATPHLPGMAAVFGAGGGLAVGILFAYYLAVGPHAGPVEWIGRSSYALIAWAGCAHAFILTHTALLLRREGDGGRSTRRGTGPTLTEHRRRGLDEVSRLRLGVAEARTRDEALVEELVEVLARPLLSVRRDLPRVPLYGYLGTVAGILMMAGELARVDEATQSFKVLGSMAGALDLAFRTTLVGLLAYLPLRKGADYLIQQVAVLEDGWVRLGRSRAGER